MTPTPSHRLYGLGAILLVALLICARKFGGAGEALPGPTGESNTLCYRGRGVFVCISPWNFPLAIFLGQVATQVRESALRMTDVRVRYPDRLRFGTGRFRPGLILNQWLLLPAAACMLGLPEQAASEMRALQAMEVLKDGMMVAHHSPSAARKPCPNRIGVAADQHPQATHKW